MEGLFCQLILTFDLTQQTLITVIVPEVHFFSKTFIRLQTVDATIWDKALFYSFTVVFPTSLSKKTKKR